MINRASETTPDRAIIPPTRNGKDTGWSRGEFAGGNDPPLISVVMPVYNVDPHWLSLAVQSVRRQSYPYWQLCIADDASARAETRDYLRAIDDPRIRIVFLETNQGIAGASNAALALATGTYVAFLDHDDELAPNALFEVAQAIHRWEPDLIYSDEEYIKRSGRRHAAHFKPDYSPDLLLAINYICHLTVYRRQLLDRIGGLRDGYDGAQDHDLLLRVLDHTDKVTHIPQVLYRWRRIPGSTADRFDSKHYAWEAGRDAIADTLRRRGIAGRVHLGKSPGTYQVCREIVGRPKVSIIIPFRDRPELLRACLNSILTLTTYQNFEVIGVSNDSREETTYTLMAHYERQDTRVRFVRYDHPFNFSAISNYAVSLADGDHILLLNNDVEVITSNWLEALLEHSQQAEVGAVGAKLYYPNDTIQHAGVIIGIGGVAGHSHKCFAREDPGYYHRLEVIQNISAVTAACLMVKRKLYETIGGFDEHLVIAFNDVDFCLRLREQGYLNIFTPYCELYHHESCSRGYEITRKKWRRFYQESQYFRNRHAALLDRGDPYYNINLPLNRENFGLKFRWLRPFLFALRDEWMLSRSFVKMTGKFVDKVGNFIR
ncbi:MAG: glycosyltransferase family 2 protein [Candidatus Competibacter sp.]|nr:glycosyltransferase family 2 protein [Candidatus Competibacter sp.]